MQLTIRTRRYDQHTHHGDTMGSTREKEVTLEYRRPGQVSGRVWLMPDWEFNIIGRSKWFEL